MSAQGRSTRLGGRVVFLSASVPDLRREREYRVNGEPGDMYERVEDAHVEVERAVVSLARAVFSAGGRLAFGGHPSISPLVAMVASEYRHPALAEPTGERPRTRGEDEDADAPPVLIYQSRAFEEVVPSESWLLHRLGYAKIRWTEAVDGERYRPDLAGQPQCPASLARMRQTMLEETDPVAMVAIGGMRGVRDEAELFFELVPRRTVFVMENTGGAAAWLANRARDAVQPLDRRVVESLRRFDREMGAERDDGDLERGDGVTYRYTPYPLIMQLLVEELAEPGEPEPRRL